MFFTYSIFLFKKKLRAINKIRVDFEYNLPLWLWQLIYLLVGSIVFLFVLVSIRKLKSYGEKTLKLFEALVLLNSFSIRVTQTTNIEPIHVHVSKDQQVWIGCQSIILRIWMQKKVYDIRKICLGSDIKFRNDCIIITYR